MLSEKLDLSFSTKTRISDWDYALLLGQILGLPILRNLAWFLITRRLELHRGGVHAWRCSRGFRHPNTKVAQRMELRKKAPANSTSSKLQSEREKRGASNQCTRLQLTAMKLYELTRVQGFAIPLRSVSNSYRIMAAPKTRTGTDRVCAGQNGVWTRADNQSRVWSWYR